MTRKSRAAHTRRSDSLLARLRFAMLQYIGISDEHRTSDAAIRRRVLEIHRANPAFGRLLVRFLALEMTWVAPMGELSLAFDIKDLLSDLENSPWPGAEFLEIENGAPTLSDSTGVLIYQEELMGGGQIYVISVFKEAKFPRIFRAEIRASAARPEPFLSVGSQNGYVTRSQSDIAAHWDDLEPEIKIGLLALYHINSKKRGMVMHPAHAAHQQGTEELFPPPEDEYCDRLLGAVIGGRATCTKLDISLNNIRPANYEFAFLFPAAVVRPFIYEIAEGNRPELLLYWKDEGFIVSDDYAAYLAYRAVKVDVVPAIVMGNYPRQVFGNGPTGGKELLPNLVYRLSHMPDDLPGRESKLEQRIQRDLGPRTNDKLYALAFQLHRYLNDPLLKERRLHDLLLRGAQEFAQGAFKVLSEVRLGNQYRIDLVFQPIGSTRRVTLVELERANLPVFRKNGAPTAYVTHALQQVEDWFRYWHEHPDEVRQGLDPTIVPDGVVVIGRSKAFSEDQRRRLLSLNANRRIQLITYDELAERLESYIVLQT